MLKGRRLAVLGTGGLGAPAARQARHFGMITTGIRASGEPHPDFDRVGDDGRAGRRAAAQRLPAAGSPPHAGHHRPDHPRPPAGGCPRGPVSSISAAAPWSIRMPCATCSIPDISAAPWPTCSPPEPIPEGHRLWTTKNLVITPHMSADDPNTYAADSVAIFLDNVKAYVEGRPLPNRFDTARGY